MITDYYALGGLGIAAGLTAHMLFYRPTESLPRPWRELIRYAIGGVILTALILGFALLRPNATALTVGGVAPITLLATGYGTYLGYLLDRPKDQS